MTEVTFDKRTFLATLEAFQKQFTLASTDALLETTSADRFMLEVKRSDNQDVRAFGPCEVKGEMVHISFDFKEVEQAVISAHEGIEAAKVTLIVGDGIWVKEPEAFESAPVPLPAPSAPAASANKSRLGSITLGN
ncbi:MAG: hypothetical protein Q8922_15615 [Bacteroidota bacterium]|nr:hypothetical protein [Bacteroidota bacterium]MDP4234804.1 hypothetical protein [Bacteroidota bacterium]MDP4289342.1 hypothetical protein [Bacteroidota bacterium]